MYQAIVGKVESVRPILGADRIHVVTVYGADVVMSVATQPGDVVVYFPSDGQLAEEFARANDLIGYTDEQGNKRGGYFASNLRVRAQKFKGVQSDGFAITPEAFAYLGAEVPDFLRNRVGLQFTSLGGHEVCRKYLTPGTRAQINQTRKTKKGGSQVLWAVREYEFPKHYDTEQWRFVRDTLPDEAMYYITEKMHGTSHRMGKIAVQSEWRLFGWPIPFTHKIQYRVQHGSRNVDLQAGIDSYYGDEFRLLATQHLNDRLMPDEILYGEIVGFTTSGKPIMDQHTATTKDLIKIYGSALMTYTYGQLPNSARFYVYRITVKGQELSFDAMRLRAAELDVPVAGVEYLRVAVNKSEVDAILDSVDKMPYSFYGGESRHPLEGVCIRAELPGGKYVGTYKHKTFNFKVLEGLVKDHDVVDLEESA